MAQETIVIGNLKTQALYVSSFLAEVYSDSAYTNQVGSQTVAAVKDPQTGYWTNAALLSFPGLNQGQTYYIQAGPVSPGGVANLTKYTLGAPTIQTPATTYSAQVVATSSGINYDITPSNPPTDLDHYEAIWAKDGSNPSNTSPTNMWSGYSLSTGLIHLFVSGVPGDQITLFLRTVTTKGVYQNWVEVDQETIPQFYQLDMTSQRSIGTVYQNNSTNAIWVSGHCLTHGSSTGRLEGSTGATTSLGIESYSQDFTATVEGGHCQFGFKVPPGYYYALNFSGAFYGIGKWFESLG